VNIGVHISISKGISDSVLIAKKLGCSTMQIFSKNPRGWSAKELPKEEILNFKDNAKKYSIKPVVIHTSYLINLSSNDKILYKKSINSFIEEIKRAEVLNVDYLNTHIGTSSYCFLKDGLNKVVDAITEILERTRTRVYILLENTARAGNYIGGRFSDLVYIIKKVKSENIGITFDTCHAFAYGYNIRTKEGLRNILSEIHCVIDKLKLIHANDSKFPLGSGIDRHEDIGKGYIGIEGFKVIVNNDYLRDLPFILETPKMSLRSDIKNLNTLKKCFENKG